MPQLTLFLSGHGGWKPSFGYVQTPRGVSVVFYTHFAKDLITSMEYKILEGSFTQADRVIGEFSMCPNMQVSGQSADWTTMSQAKLNKAHWGAEAHVLGVPEGESANLSEICDGLTKRMSQGDTLILHWIACSHLELNPQGGEALGVNAIDYRHEKKPGRFRIDKVDGTFTWV
jgi:hypothetical protein